MKQANAVLGLLAQTPIHAGTGQNTGVIDLPIQREGHNGYPCIFGSSMKGALRNHAEAHYSSTESKVTLAFGPDTQSASDYGGALMVSDARLLLLPIRSLTSPFKWVTCREALKRYQRDAARFGVTAITGIPEEPDDETAIMPQASSTTLFLEEYQFKTEHQPLNEVIQCLTTLMCRDDAEMVLRQQLVLVSDSIFSHMAPCL